MQILSRKGKKNVSLLWRSGGADSNTGACGQDTRVSETEGHLASINRYAWLQHIKLKVCEPELEASRNLSKNILLKNICCIGKYSVFSIWATWAKIVSNSKHSFCWRCSFKTGCHGTPSVYQAGFELRICASDSRQSTGIKG